MSSQPTTAEKISNKATDAVNTLTQPAAEEEPPKPQVEVHREALAEAARPRQEPEPGLLEKVKAYIPGLGGKTDEEAKAKGDATTEGQGEGLRPQRPDDDPKVEGFLRGVYSTGAEERESGKKGGS